MSVFAYDPEAVRTWGNTVINYLNGGSESISSCSSRFSQQIENLVQPNVWTGAAAQQNYQNFLETHQALINFVNNFGEAFESSMNSINANVANLEASNLGTSTNVSTFGNLSYAQLTQLSEENIKQDVVRYDYAVISSIGKELDSIYADLETVNENLVTKISELNNGSSIWDGDAAENAKETLLEILNNNMAKVKEAFQICISNIKTAAEAAQTADSGR